MNKQELLSMWKLNRKEDMPLFNMAINNPCSEIEVSDQDWKFKINTIKPDVATSLAATTSTGVWQQLESTYIHAPYTIYTGTEGASLLSTALQSYSMVFMDFEEEEEWLTEDEIQAKKDWEYVKDL